jgi:hypothetical protein
MCVCSQWQVGLETLLLWHEWLYKDATRRSSVVVSRRIETWRQQPNPRPTIGENAEEEGARSFGQIHAANWYDEHSSTLHDEWRVSQAELKHWRRIVCALRTQCGSFQHRWWPNANETSSHRHTTVGRCDLPLHHRQGDEISVLSVYLFTGHWAIIWEAAITN